MLSIQIYDVKEFMEHLLRGNMFHPFCLWEAAVKTSASYHIDGRLNRDFFGNDELSVMGDGNYIPWQMAKSQVFSIIKGKRLPLSMKFILILSVSQTNRLLEKYNLPIGQEQIGGLFFNIRYDGGQLSGTTGVSYTTFTMDKRLETAFDDSIRAYLKHYRIVFEDNSAC